MKLRTSSLLGKCFCQANIVLGTFVEVIFGLMAEPVSDLNEELLCVGLRGETINLGTCCVEAEPVKL